MEDNLDSKVWVCALFSCLNTVVVLILLKKFTAEFSASAPVVYKNPPPMGPEISHTTGAGKGGQSVRYNFFLPTAVVLGGPS